MKKNKEKVGGQVVTRKTTRCILRNRGKYGIV